MDNIEVWLAVDKSGQEAIFPEKPEVGWTEYTNTEWQCLEWINDEESRDLRINLPKGTIKKLTGIDLKFESGPLKYK